MNTSEQLILNPEELFYLAKSRNGIYLDYDYISAMKEIGQNKAFFAQECRHHLEAKGLLEEEFDGTITYSSTVEELIDPIYAGEYESVLSCYDGTEQSFLRRFHRMRDNIIAVELENKNIKISAIENIQNYVEELLCDYLHDNEISDFISKEKIESVILVKGIEPEKKSVVNAFYGSNGSIYEEQVNGDFKRIITSSFMARVMEILTGGSDGIYR